MSQLELDMPDDTDGSTNGDEVPVSDASDGSALPDVGRLLYRINNMMKTDKRKKGRRWEEQDPRLSNGDIAKLRRISPRAPITPALWRVLHYLDIAEAPQGQDQDKYERKWAVLLMGMAHCAGMHDGRRREDRISFGRALAEAGWSEQRFVRLLETPPDRLGVRIRRVAQFLSSKRQHADWKGVYYLLFMEEDKAKDTRLYMARSYYGTLYRKEKDDDEE
jgi:CRISPR system Cascade subunit CasB